MASPDQLQPNETKNQQSTRQPEPIRACIDVALPIELITTAANEAMSENPENAPMVLPAMLPSPVFLAVVTGKRWKPGRTLRVSFMDGDPAVQQRIPPIAKRWEEHANVKFNFVDDPRAEIRISFANPGSWSYIGTDALTIPFDQPTMNYGWLTPQTSDEEYTRVVIHEFGHALGFIHEHQNPSATIPWDREAVYKYYQGPPNNWTREQVDINLFQRYARDITQFSDFDRESIMIYPVPNKFTLGDYEIGWSNDLSESDKQYAGMFYPFDEKPVTELTVDGDPVEDSIGEFGEIDTFTFRVEEAARYRIETEGRTDVVMALYGPNDNTRLIDEDDDSGRGLNARIVDALEAGSYTVRVRHFSKEKTGDYKIGVYKA